MSDFKVRTGSVSPLKTAATGDAPAKSPALQTPLGPSGPFSGTRTERAKANVERVLAVADIEIGGSRPWDIQVHDERFYTRVLSDPDLQLGETYMDGLWDCAAVDEMCARLMATDAKKELLAVPALLETPGLLTRAWATQTFRNLRDSVLNRQTRTRSPKVAKEHYDAGNELYRRMLDATMTYTSGVYGEGFDLQDAQNAKYDLLCRKLDLKPGDKVLDIGCGFGGFARFAAKNYGAEVTGITISGEQLKAARALSEDVDGVTFEHCDYRDLPLKFEAGTFDHVVSIEMIEAVGQKNLHPYFESASAVLKDGGRFALQAIASNKDVVNCNTWFSKYIFHDGVAPSRNQVDKAASTSFGGPADVHRITPHYDQTLLDWHDGFTDAWPDLAGDYSDRFKRMWDFYLRSVAGGFRAEELQLDQVVYVKGGAPEGIEPIRELPTRKQLDGWRATEAEEATTKAKIDQLEAKRQHVNEVLATPKVEKGALPKDARICVLGGGPSGLTVAHELKQLGHTNVVVLERDDEVGGKSHTVSIEGRPHDLGATMGVSGKYRDVVAFADEVGVETVQFPDEVNYDLGAGGPAQPRSRGEQARLMLEAVRYAIGNTLQGGLSGIEVPDESLADPFPVVTRRQGLNEFQRTMDTYLTGYGYGDPKTTPAIYGYRMLDLRAVAGARKPRLMWEDGTRPIWRGLAEGMDVRTGQEVVDVDRSGDKVKVKVAGQDSAMEFDRLVVACDPKAALSMLDASYEERDLFGQVQHMPYSTFACRVGGIADGKSEVGYLAENMDLERMGHPMAWIKRHADDDVFVFHLFAPEGMSDAEVMKKIDGDMKQLGATNVELVDSRRWDFFPHVSGDSMRLEKFFERAAHLQGQSNTVYANEALSMSTMADVAGYAKKVAQRLSSGEY